MSDVFLRYTWFLLVYMHGFLVMCVCIITKTYTRLLNMACIWYLFIHLVCAHTPEHMFMYMQHPPVQPHDAPGWVPMCACFYLFMFYTHVYACMHIHTNTHFLSMASIFAASWYTRSDANCPAAPDIIPAPGNIMPAPPLSMPPLGGMLLYGCSARKGTQTPACVYRQ